MISLDYPDAGFGTIELSFSYADLEVLREVDFHVMPGEVHALVGKQNEGKSTLRAVLTGAVKPAAGWILAGGKPYRSLTPAMARELGIEWVGKDARVFPDLTVAENIFMGNDCQWWRRIALWGSGFKKVLAWLAEFDIDLPYANSIRDLRKEDWLFVELLSRLRRRPRLLILDETLEQLTDRRIRDFKRIATTLMNQGMAILWITHKIEEAIETSQRITVLRHGRVLFASHAADIDKVSLVRVCFSELGKEDSEDVTREQFYELIRFIEAMLRDLPAMVLIADLDKRIRLVNRSARNAFGADGDPGGKTLDDFLARLNPRIAGEMDAAIEQRADREWHGVTIRFGSGQMLVDVRIHGIQERGVRVGHMLVIEDVSVREEMRRQLALSDNLASVGLLAAGVAHEVNDPLAIISNYLGYIRHEVDNAEVGRAVRLAQDEIGRIQQIVDNLVAFSGNDAPSSEAVDIMALAEEVCNLLRFHTDARKVKFTC
ncbi:MAG: ATP-binding cassette domain-containing protein, partial [Planctomycetes bacterium]|nr:ATP-binding cassette domain-containing protein [Planctomycetota bacterium]